MQPLCDQKLRFSVADQSVTGRRQLSLKVGDRLATGGRLIANWLEISCNYMNPGYFTVAAIDLKP